MSRWRPLPGDLPPSVRRLVEELRLNKDRSKLTLTSLAAKTSHSRSSWHRYLNGRALPPWPAVEALGTVTRADRERLRVLWESATAAWEPKPSDRPRAGAAEAPAPAAGAAEKSLHAVGRSRADAPARRSLRRAAAVGHVLLVCGLLAAALFLLRSGSHSDTSSGRPPGGPEGTPAWPWELETPPVPAGGAACTGRTCQGQDPYREKCDHESFTIHALSAYGHELRLQYSTVCRAAWAEVDPAPGTARLLVAAAGTQTQDADPGATRTAMAAVDRRRARACVETAGQQLCVTEHDSWLGPVSGHGTGRG